MRGSGQGVRAVTVNAVTAPNTGSIMTSPCRLCGWSLLAGDVAGATAESSVTSPAAGATIATVGALAQGDYQVAWQVQLAGTVAAIDADNFQLQQAGAGLVLSDNPGTVGEWIQSPVTVAIPAGGATLSVVAVALGTVGAIYTAQLALSAVGAAQGQLLDAKQPLGLSGVPIGQSDTQWLADGGIYVSTSLSLKALQGTLSGVVYVIDADEYEQGRAWQSMRSTNSP